MRAVFLDYDTVSRDDLDASALLRTVPQIELRRAANGADTADLIRGARIIVLNYTSISRVHLAEAQALELIAVMGTGTDHIDVAAARERRIGVCNVPGYCTASVAQHVWALILGLSQSLAQFSRMAHDGNWAKLGDTAALAHPIRELRGRIFGVIGWGDLGREAARIAEAFGMRVLRAARRGGAAGPGRVAFDEVLRTADIVSLHCPLDATTRGMIGERELSLMKRDALLINTARGGLIDGQALAAALCAGRIAGAGLDVLPVEPPDALEPLTAPGIPNLLITPHVAWAAREARQRCLDETAANVQDFLCGGRRNRID